MVFLVASDERLYAFRDVAKIPIRFVIDTVLNHGLLAGYNKIAKMFNVWLLHQGTAAAHRNRIDFLKGRLIRESATAARAGR